MQRIRWSDDQKAEALRLLAEVGQGEAARRTGIPQGTIASWGKRNGVTAPPLHALAAQVERKQLTIAERKAELATGLMSDIERMRRDLFAPTTERKVAVAGQMREPQIVTVRHPTTTHAERRTAIDAIQKAVETVQLLTGEATERIEQLGGGSTVEAARAVLVDVRERHLKAVG